MKTLRNSNPEKALHACIGLKANQLASLNKKNKKKISEENHSLRPLFPTIVKILHQQDELWSLYVTREIVSINTLSLLSLFILRKDHAV